ncbi:hypothetical protein BH23THE1_BH23THE1_35960 [soil metagenome]
MRKNNPIEIAKGAYKREGLNYLVDKGLRFTLDHLRNYLFYWYYKKLYSKKTFEFQGKKYNYYHHHRGRTWKTERSVEIPIVWAMVTEFRKQNKRILEVGNVLSYRFNIDHEVLDKYEMVPGVINQDVVSYSPDKPYDLIVSISTMEHVGWDESPRDPSKLLRGIQNLTNMLSYGGKMIITLPLGQNSFLDELLNKNIAIFDKQYYLRRESNLFWRQEKWEKVMDISYDEKVPCANGILIGMIEKNN